MKSVSPVRSTIATTMTIGQLTAPVATSTASVASAIVRAASTSIIARRRSSLSARAPAGSLTTKADASAAVPDRTCDERRVSQREYEQRIGERSDLRAEIGENLPDPQQPEVPVCPQRA